MKQVTAFFTLIFLLLSSAMLTVQAGVPIQPAHTGSWFIPAFPGRGGFINIADGDGGPVFVVSWFGYTDGNQSWLIGSMPFEPGIDGVRVPMVITRLESNGHVIENNWGSFSFEFDSCNTGRLIAEPNDPSDQS